VRRWCFRRRGSWRRAGRRRARWDPRGRRRWSGRSRWGGPGRRRGPRTRRRPPGGRGRRSRSGRSLRGRGRPGLRASQDLRHDARGLLGQLTATGRRPRDRGLGPVFARSGDATPRAATAGAARCLTSGDGAAPRADHSTPTYRLPAAVREQASTGLSTVVGGRDPRQKGSIRSSQEGSSTSSGRIEHELE
jgi:hypothetical protein